MIKAYERPKGDLISREALKKAINDNGYSHYFEIFAIIDNAPTVEPTFKPIAEIKLDKEQLQEIVDKAKVEVMASVERPQGKWIKQYGKSYELITNEGVFVGELTKCPKCQYDKARGSNFCPNCGADMRGKEE